MDESPITHPGVAQEVYQTLGVKTFWIFCLQRAQAAVILLLLSIVLFALSQQSFLITQQFGDLRPDAAAAGDIVAGLFLIFFALIFLVSWLIYINYKFCLGEDSLKIKRGILNKEEVAIPYRQIQDVDLKRDLVFQMIGLSRLQILTAGHEDGQPQEDDAEGILPALDKDLAEWLQAQLLQRSNVQKVVEEK